MPKETTQRVPLLTVTECPEGMTFEAYKLLLRQQDKALKAYKRGQLVHVSNGLETLKTTDGGQVIARRTQTYRKPKPQP